jgi:alpha-L-rhamnosidase
MFGGVGQWLYENVAGIRPLEPGYRKIAFDPTLPDGLTHAEASYDSVRGTIRSSWTRSGSVLTMDVTVPANATGLVYVPASEPAAITVDDAANARFVAKQGSRLLYQIASGRYRFTVRVPSRALR